MHEERTFFSLSFHSGVPSTPLIFLCVIFYLIFFAVLMLRRLPFRMNTFPSSLKLNEYNNIKGTKKYGK